MKCNGSKRIEMYEILINVFEMDDVILKLPMSKLFFTV